MKEKRCAALLLNFLTKKAPYKGPGADSEEKHEPVSDIDTVVMDSLKVLDPNRPIREADITEPFQYPDLSRYDAFQVWGRDMKRRGGDGKLRDVVVSLAEDNTVMVYANWRNDAATVFSSFTLPEPVAEEDFDAARYVKMIERF